MMHTGVCGALESSGFRLATIYRGTEYLCKPESTNEPRRQSTVCCARPKYISHLDGLYTLSSSQWSASVFTHFPIHRHALPLLVLLSYQHSHVSYRHRASQDKPTRESLTLSDLLPLWRKIPRRLWRPRHGRGVWSQWQQAGGVEWWKQTFVIAGALTGFCAILQR